MKEKDKEGGKGEKDSPLLQIDPKCFQDALRTFFQPIKNDDARLDFYTMYKKEATEYDTDYVKKYDEDLNTTLIFAGLFSAVSSAFVIDVHSGLQPDPNEQSAALLRAILLTLNQSAIPNETPTIPPIQENPPSDVVTVTGLMYASLLISLLAAFIAMLGKQWLNRYLRHAGGSMIERCGDRQRKCDGLKKWPFHLFVESLPLMLQVALLLLACGLCKRMSIISTPVALILITLTALGALFYLGIVIVGTSSYECPFQTPVSTALRRFWKTAGPRIVTTFHFILVIGTYSVWLPVLTTLRRLWEAIQCQILCIILWLPPITQRRYPRHRSLPIAQRTPQQDISLSASLRGLWENIQSRLPRMAPHLPHIPPLSTSITPPTSLWLTPVALTTLRGENASDVRCISWILWNITDPEALDAAIRLAGTVHWFEDGLTVEPPYNQIISVLKGCVDSNGRVYPGLKDRVYYSARAVLWIHICAMCESKELAKRFPLPAIAYDATSLDPDLWCLLESCTSQNPTHTILALYSIYPETTPTHLQWASNALLHFSWAMQTAPDTFHILSQRPWFPISRTIPLNALLNRLLASCIFFGWPVDKELLRIQDKIDRFDQILSQFSQAMIQAIHTSHPHCGHILGLLNHLQNSGIRTKLLTGMAYQWCSVVCENHLNLQDGKDLILLSLEIGFRHLDFEDEDNWIEAELIHTEHHQGLAYIILQGGNQDAMADLLCAWTSTGSFHEPYPSLNICAWYLTDLHHLYPFSPRLQKFITYIISLIGYQPFELAGVAGLVGLLNDLQICTEDTKDHASQWANLLLDIVQSPRGARHLLLPYWELLMEHIANGSSITNATYTPHTTEFLREAMEWHKLECWMSIVWILCPPEKGSAAEDIENATHLLFHHQPDAIQRLKKKVECHHGETPELLQKICDQVDVEGA